MQLTDSSKVTEPARLWLNSIDLLIFKINGRFGFVSNHAHRPANNPPYFLFFQSYPDIDSLNPGIIDSNNLMPEKSTGDVTILGASKCIALIVNTNHLKSEMVGFFWAQISTSRLVTYAS